MKIQSVTAVNRTNFSDVKKMKGKILQQAKFSFYLAQNKVEWWKQ